MDWKDKIEIPTKASGYFKELENNLNLENMQNEISTVMEDIKVISELVVRQQIEWAANPRHNEYMQLQWNVGVLKDKLSELQELKDKLSELQELMKFK